MKNQTKLIKILSRGFVITGRGRVCAPIYNPYRESVDNIYNMLCGNPRPKIVEVLGNGREIELTLQNYDKNNEKIHPSMNPASVTPSVNKLEQQDGTTTEEQSKEKDQPQQNTDQSDKQQQYGNGKKNKNKHKNTQQQSEQSISQQETIETDIAPENIENDCEPVK